MPKHNHNFHNSFCALCFLLNLQTEEKTTKRIRNLLISHIVYSSRVLLFCFDDFDPTDFQNTLWLGFPFLFFFSFFFFGVGHFNYGLRIPKPKRSGKTHFYQGQEFGVLIFKWNGWCLHRDINPCLALVSIDFVIKNTYFVIYHIYYTFTLVDLNCKLILWLKTV